jgi:hypothetical protein
MAAKLTDASVPRLLGAMLRSWMVPRMTGHGSVVELQVAELRTTYPALYAHLLVERNRGFRASTRC